MTITSHSKTLQVRASDTVLEPHRFPNEGDKSSKIVGTAGFEPATLDPGGVQDRV